MSTHNRNNAINTTYENELNKRACNKLTNQTKSAIHHHQDQVPTPEPRGKLHQVNHTLAIKGQGDKLEDELAMDNQQVASLVKVKQSHNQAEQENDNEAPDKMSNQYQRRTDSVYNELQKRTSFNDVPVEFVADEGVSSPSNVDYDEEIGDEYYEDEDEYDTSESAGELANLSRQSMVPLHELIAYYQYIQQGNSQVNSSAVSRQSSSASQQTTKTKYSQQTDDNTIEGGKTRLSDENHGEEKDLDSANYSAEGPINRTHVPEIHVENPATDNVDSEQNFEKNDVPIKSDQNTSKADKRRIRTNVVLELINSERDFVKHLRDVVEGYLYPARRHPEIFTGERINTIFANIEQLYEFQRKFLESLESNINWDDLAKSEVGRCFLEYEKGFSVYHHYCNNHPNATSELQDLYTKPRFVKFFEACRLLQNMIDISLDGFLLTPIQKICKYPLQLTELLKNTDEDHPDYIYVADALESMRNCANLANERKRRIEALADVMSFQEKVENWFGPKLSDTSSILIHSGEVSKMNSHTWSQNVQLYLFDHLLLYSKKDLLKRNSTILKGRICMDTVTEISDADEYKPKKSFKLYCSEQQKWFVFVTRSEKEKDEWIQAFERERNLVETDEIEGFQITEREIGVARRTLQNRKHSRSARYRHKRPDTAIVDQLDIDDANMIMNRTLSLPSCIHPSHVMNFVEDSRIVSSRKKNTSPSSSSRSPNASSQYLTQDQELNQTSGNWFKKMGSKKLSKSQVYNVNGQTGPVASNLSAKSSLANSPTGGVLATAASIVSNDTAAIKYDQLEKRHRDHMVSEEQARLFRLNNDLPPPSLFTRSATPTMVGTQHTKSPMSPPHHRQGGIVSNSSPHQRRPQSIGYSSQTSDNQSGSQLIGQRTAASSNDPQNLNFKSLSLSQNHGTLASATDQKHVKRPDAGATFEATVLLSSGRVVKVREDAV